VAVANLGKQEKFAARAAVLWQTLEGVTRQAPPGACVAWLSGPQLDAQEAVHFLWHLQARGRTDLALCVLDEQGRPLTSAGASAVPTADREPSFLVSGQPGLPDAGRWREAARFRSSYWARRRHYDTYLWTVAPRRR
jgi:hypothetical protein